VKKIRKQIIKKTETIWKMAQMVEI
jgi:hypothetical protein